MKKNILLLSLFLVSFTLQAQQRAIHEIVTINRKDTLRVQTFDQKGRMICWKSYPQFGMNQLLIYTYVNDKLTSYIWSHSNAGLSISEYEYDTIENTRLTYSYSYKPNEKNTPIPKLILCKNEQDLKALPEYIMLHQPERRYLKEKLYFKDTVKMKETTFNSNGDLLSTTLYSYENGLLKSVLEKENNKRTNELIYHYDTQGNEIQSMKIFNRTDTSFVYNKTYKDGYLIKSVLQEGDQIGSTTDYKYSENMLQLKQEFDARHELKIQSKYIYKSGQLDKIEGFNLYMNQQTTDYYYYY